MSVRSTLATYEFYLGHLEKSKQMFEDLMSNKLSNSTYYNTKYYVGLICFEQGDEEEAKKCLNEALKVPGHPYFKDRIIEVLNKIS